MTVFMVLLSVLAVVEFGILVRLGLRVRATKRRVRDVEVRVNGLPTIHLDGRRIDEALTRHYRNRR